MGRSKIGKIFPYVIIFSLVFFACRYEQASPAAPPNEINSIISIGPSNTEILTALGFGSRIIATDAFSDGIEGIRTGISIYSMMQLDLEHIISLKPDIVFVTGMTFVDGDQDPLRMVREAGIYVVYLPTSTSIEDIKNDIRHIAAVMGVEEDGESLVEYMESEIELVRQISHNINLRRSIYFEISPAPFMYSFGRGTFLHEMIEIAGGENIFSFSEGWMAVPDELLLSANPDVILTTVDFLDDPVSEIMSRPGWSVIAAVQNMRVYSIDANYSSRPSHNIIRALWEIARALYPEYYQ